MRINKVEATGTNVSSVHRAFFFSLSATFLSMMPGKTDTYSFCLGVLGSSAHISNCFTWHTQKKNTKCKKLFKNSEKS